MTYNILQRRPRHGSIMQGRRPLAPPSSSPSRPRSFHNAGRPRGQAGQVLCEDRRLDDPPCTDAIKDFINITEFDAQTRTQPA